MCVNHRFRSDFFAREHLDEAQEALRWRQYQKALDRLDLAAKEIENQRESLMKFVEKELQSKINNFQETEENIAKLKKLSDQLGVIENEANAEVQKIKGVLKDRLREQKDFLTDYEIEIQVGFYLREDDPESREDDDNLLATLSCFDYIGFEEEDENYDYKDGDRWHLPFRHSVLFHVLCEHIKPKKLHWSDIFRIGTVWVDIKVNYQKKYDMETRELIRDNWVSPDDAVLHYKLKK